MARTKHFANDVVDLLRHSPHYRMSFSKFIPAFHRHLGRQCRVASYGFTKLIELFEAIPYAVQVVSFNISWYVLIQSNVDFEIFAQLATFSETAVI